ncbi:DUF2197 domain-containing protein [Alkalihalobacillus pseudalcaliphilus]|uniref:DUF2197 domain-containing protein n=1 Tax=Alkalihalobacillus pseudalcaliphilus TaxID=79884 RepID=UPI000A02591E|nr:DUF2197 domain-containing protein [Alkalihalobacillus pseudalcaliphilus]
MNMYYEVSCYSCKVVFKVYEGSLAYKQFKERKTKMFTCDDCQHRIRLEAINNFFR